jgi:hypothetical protein
MCNAGLKDHAKMMEEQAIDDEITATTNHLYGPTLTMPRGPSREELDKILFSLLDADTGNGCGAFDMDATFDALTNARVCIFDNYITDGPGYVGRVAVVVWAGGPEIVSVVTLDGKQGGRVVMESF